MSLHPTIVGPAQAMLASGLCVLPARRQMKRPAVPAWSEYQKRRPTADDFAAMASRPDADAICLVCGAVSGNLELLDFDCQGEAYDAWAALVEAELPGLVAGLLIEKSQSGGKHVVYLSEAIVGGNTKIAAKVLACSSEGDVAYKGKSYRVRRNVAKLEAYPDLIETRGEGGIFLCWPSPMYEIIQGTFSCIPLATAHQREVMHRCAKALNEKPATVDDVESTKEAKACPPPPSGELRPGDDYQLRGNLQESLLRCGWVLAAKTGENELWRRPGKTESWSATFNGEVFFCHSSNADPFAVSTGYSKFQAYAILEHNGDYSAAARTLSELGYGTKREPIPTAPPPDVAAAARPAGEKKEKKPKKEKAPPKLKDGQKALDVNHPDLIADACAQGSFLQGATPILRRFNEEWLLWNGTRYEPRTDDDMKVKFWHFLKKHVMLKGETVVHPTRFSVDETFAAMARRCNTPATTETPTMFIGPDARPVSSPQSVIAFSNGLYDIETGKLYDHTPAWFSVNALEYPYDPAVTCPQWDSFVGEVSQTELDWIDALQMWFGYNLIADTSQQKLMLFVGPPRSGKGTVCRAMQCVLGKHNYCNPSLTLMGEHFGMAPLVGKLAAIVPDAHMGRRADSVRIMEALKSIVGEDHQTVEFKHKDAFTIKINTRFTISVNELVQFPDASGSMASRTIVLPFRVGHVGHEDITLSSRIASEASGIANWAIEGLHKLRSVGKLLQPQAGMQILNDFDRLSSPIRGFLEDYCTTGPTNAAVPCDMMRAMWRIWCEETGNEPGSDNKFGERLYAARPEVKRVQRGPRGDTTRRYEGIDLNEQGKKVYLEREYAGKLPGTGERQ